MRGLIGNLLGCVLAAFALHALPDSALLVLTIAAIGFSHAYAPVRYRVTSTSACVMALMVMHFSNPGAESLLLARLLDTAIGAAIAIAFSFMLPVWERQGLPDRIAALPNVSALMWGAEDLVASIGGTSSRKPNGRYRDIARYARARVLLAAGARGKAAVDAVHLDIEDTKRLAIEAADAAASGFTATACIHPSQVTIIRDAYRPDEKTVDWARGVLAAAETERGVFTYDGRMVDEPVLRHAR